jgi:hypothetical protein
MARGQAALSTIPELPEALADLADLALDLRWTRSHAALRIKVRAHVGRMS